MDRTRGFIDMLRATPLFARISSLADLCQLERLAVLRRVAPGTEIVRQDEAVAAISLICTGEVSVCFSGGSVESLRLGRGSLFGEMEYFSGSPGLATVLSAEPTELVCIDQTVLRRISDDNPMTGMQLYHGFLVTMVEKHRLVTDSLIRWKLDHSREHLAHDLRGPLATLRALSEGNARLPPREREIFALVVARMDAIVATLAAPTARKSPICAALQQLVCEKRAQHAARPEVRLAFEAAPLTTDAVDAAQLPQLMRIMANLIDNGVEAMGAAGGRVRIGVGGDAEVLRLDVEDDGCGIPPAVRARLGRQPYTHGKAAGLGLGVFHAFRTVQAWGGSMRIYSHDGQGTIVRLELPTQGAAAALPTTHVHRQPTLPQGYARDAAALGSGLDGDVR